MRNGFYWITVPHPDNPNIIEVRKGDNGTRAWTINPGEYCNAFDGKHGGLWRVRGRAMCKLLGVSFSSFGLTYSSYYRRAPDSELPECSWIMEGIGLDEPIGDFGLIGDGAAGLELDRYDLELGTPHRAYLLAHSEGHNDMFVSGVNILRETGGNLAETFDTIVGVIRERIRVQQKVDQYTAHQ